MSLNSDYMMRILTRQRHQELMAEAANDRLILIARQDGTSWWRHLIRGAREASILVGGRRHRLAGRLLADSRGG